MTDELDVELAWDVYLIYEAGQEWGPDGTPVEPDYWQHQLWDGGGGGFLDAEVFAAEIEARLPNCYELVTE